MVTAIEAALGARRRRLPLSRLDEKTSSGRRMIDGSRKTQVVGAIGEFSFPLYLGKTPGAAV